MNRAAQRETLQPEMVKNLVDASIRRAEQMPGVFAATSIPPIRPPPSCILW